MELIKNILIKLFIRDEYVRLSKRDLTPENATEEEVEAVLLGMDDGTMSRMLGALLERSGTNNVYGHNPYSLFKPHLKRAWQLGYDIGMEQPMSIELLDDGSVIGTVDE